MTPTIKQNCDQFFKEALSDLVIDKERSNILTSIAGEVMAELKSNGIANLNFICTHNSRRSMFAQVWAHYAADFFKLRDIHCFSGGTSVTALNRNTVMALQQTGFIFKLTKFSHSNPHYRITYADSEKAIMGFSKLFDDETINKPFIAITTCDNADENCPFIPNARLRFHLPFVDPKKYDHTKYQTEKYMATSKRIAGEMHFLFEKINNSL